MDSTLIALGWKVSMMNCAYGDMAHIGKACLASLMMTVVWSNEKTKPIWEFGF